MTSMSIEFKGTKGTFASLNTAELISSLESRFPTWGVASKQLDKSHTKAAQKYGGGSQAFITLRQSTAITLRSGDTVYPQIQLRDQTYGGRALEVSFGLYRQVCTNGLMGFKHVAEPIRITHHKGKAGVLMQLVNIIEASANQFAAVLAEADVSSTIVVNMPSHIITQLNLPPSLVKKVTELMNANLVRAEDNVNTAWGLYNFINEVDRLRARKNSTAYLNRDANLLGNIIELTKAA
jgi:Domain of unknown function (DUF932)